MRFAAVVSRMGLIRRFLGPFEDRELGVTAVNHDPSDRPVTFLSANLTPIHRVNHK
jgi:hypothetical protein